MRCEKNGGADSLNYCFYTMLADRWRDAASMHGVNDVLYCGKPAEGLSGADHIASLALAEMGEYAIIGRSMPISMLLSATYASNRIRQNIDIAYYLQLHLHKVLNQNPPLPKELAALYQSLVDSAPKNNLSEIRSMELDKTFDSGMHLDILRATAPCQGA